MAMMVERDARGLTPSQAAFVDGFTGCVTETAKITGLAPGYCQALMSDPKYAHVRACLYDKVREERSRRHGRVVASRLERLSMWTSIMRDKKQFTKDRLKASELLGRAHMDFAPSRCRWSAGSMSASRSFGKRTGSNDWSHARAGEDPVSPGAGGQ